MDCWIFCPTHYLFVPSLTSSHTNFFFWKWSFNLLSQLSLYEALICLPKNVSAPWKIISGLTLRIPSTKYLSETVKPTLRIFKISYSWIFFEYNFLCLTINLLCMYQDFSPREIRLKFHLLEGNIGHVYYVQFCVYSFVFWCFLPQ